MWPQAARVTYHLTVSWQEDLIFDGGGCRPCYSKMKLLWSVLPSYSYSFGCVGVMSRYWTPQGWLVLGEMESQGRTCILCATLRTLRALDPIWNVHYLYRPFFLDLEIKISRHKYCSNNNNTLLMTAHSLLLIYTWHDIMATILLLLTNSLTHYNLSSATLCSNDDNKKDTNTHILSIPSLPFQLTIEITPRNHTTWR